MTRLDGLLAAAVFGAALFFWLACIAGAEVSGDAFMPVECGWRTLGTLRPVQPSQAIYGYGVCLGGAGLITFAADMLDVARNRAIIGAAAAPLVFLAVRVAAPTIAGVSIPAARVGAVGAAALLVRHPGLIASNLGGKHGYLALTWIAIAILGWAVASTRRAPVALLVGFAAVPFAVMNHPFSLWLGAAALALVPLLHRHAGTRLMLAAAGTWVLLTLPRIRPMWIGLGSEGDFGEMTTPDITLGEALPTLWASLGTPPNLALGVGLVVLIAGLLARRPTDHPGSRVAVPAVAWGLAALVSTAGLVGTAAALGYVRAYHVQLLAPLAGLGVGVAGAAAAERILRFNAQAPVPVVLGVLLAWGMADLAAGSTGLFERSCDDAPASGATAAGSAAIQRAIAEDAQGGVLVSDLHLGNAALDVATPISLGLYRGGRGPTDPVARYWIVTGDDEARKQRLAAAPGVRTVLGPPMVRDYVVTADSPSGLRDVLCADGAEAWTGSYRTWLAWKNHAEGTDRLIPPDPLECLLPDDGAPSEDVVTGLRRTLQEASFLWVRGPDDVAGSLAGRTVLLQLFGCLDPQGAASIAWLDGIEDREFRRGTAMLSILLSPQPEYRDPVDGRLCGRPQGHQRSLALALDGTLTLDLAIDATPRTLIFDRRGRLRGTFDEPITSGTGAARRADRLLERLYAEEVRSRSQAPIR